MSPHVQIPIDFHKDGNANKTVPVNHSVSAKRVVLDLLGGVLPMLVDVAKGDWFSLDQEHITAALETRQGK